MSVVSVEILVAGIPQTVVFDNGLQAFVATVPPNVARLACGTSIGNCCCSFFSASASWLMRIPASTVIVISRTG